MENFCLPGMAPATSDCTPKLYQNQTEPAAPDPIKKPPLAPELDQLGPCQNSTMSRRVLMRCRPREPEKKRKGGTTRIRIRDARPQWGQMGSEGGVGERAASSGGLVPKQCEGLLQALLPIPVGSEPISAESSQSGAAESAGTAAG